MVRWAAPQLHDIDALTKMVDPDLEGLFPVKSLSRFADVIALCIQVMYLSNMKVESVEQYQSRQSDKFRNFVAGGT